MGKMQSNNYWSSTTNANNTNNAWIVNMWNGNVNNNNKTNNNNYVWPVRGGEWKASQTPHLFDSKPLTPTLSPKGRGGSLEILSCKGEGGLNCSPPLRGGDEGEGDIFSFRNLYHNYLKCRSNKRNTINALKFEAKAEENLFRLSEELKGRTYRPSRSICFVVERPKMREIIAADFRDRVVHHLLVQQLETIYESVFIHDSYACRVDKGIHKAVGRVQTFIRTGSDNGRKRLYSMHLDIRNFFMTIDKEILFRMIEKKVRKSFPLQQPPPPPFSKGEYLDKEHTVNISPLIKGDRGGCSFVDTLLWLAGVIIFHNPAEACIIKGKQELIPQLPPHKSLFHAEEGKGLPIGNLTSQFFANVYLNALDQFVKHTLKCRFYIRYCDDVQILDESPERLEAIREQIRLFVEGDLLLKLNEKHGRVAPVTNGIDCLGYIIRPDYTLARRRVVNNLKQRLDWFEKRLVTQSDREAERQSVEQTTPACGHPSLTKAGSYGNRVSPLTRHAAIRYDYPLIERLRAVVASYWGHLKWADTFRLRTALLRRYAWMKECFNDDVNMPVLSIKFRADFPDVKSQYRYYAARFNKSALFFQVGSFYEVYDNEAWARRMALKQLKENKRGAQYGFPVKLRDKYADALLAQGLSVVVVSETEEYIGRLKQRLPEMKIIRVSEKRNLPGNEFQTFISG